MQQIFSSIQPRTLFIHCFVNYTTMAADKKNLLLLYHRPLEPVFVGKGENNAVFVIPKTYLVERYRPIGVQLFSRFGEEAGERIKVEKIPLPDLGKVLELGRNENFSLFIEKHRHLAGQLINIFMGMRNVSELQSIAVYARDRVNPYMFNYCLSVAIFHRPDTQGLDIPTIIQCFPDKFIDSKVFTQAREESTIVPTESRKPIEIPVDYTASDLEEEHRVAYFREDLGANLHHWHWHLVYPYDGPIEVVRKDRRGELFYYMHQQILARYNFERLCNKLKRVTRFIDWRKPIKEAYFPKLNSSVASRSYPARVANQLLQNMRREQEQIQIDIDQLERWRDRIFSAIHAGIVHDEHGNQIQLTEKEGIDILGNMVESSIISPNRTFYGNLHNMGHTFISYIHDPDNRHLESFAVMGDTATAMRDPIFYRWHAYLDDIFQEHKVTLPRYTVAQLDYNGITVDALQVTPESGSPNIFNTFWQQSDVDLSGGMDFQPRGPVFVRFTHLQHEPFTYDIIVNNSGAQRRGTCRIFIAPAEDERGNPWLFRNQKNLFVEMDKFVINLKPGENVITRHSTESTVTIPFERTFHDLDLKLPLRGEVLEQFNFCGCGWPAHMLVPKGTPDGFPCHLFVMISNYADDRVNQDNTKLCSEGASYCGIRDKLYPDRRSMGYPFDRMPRDGVDTLQQFLTPNMLVQTCTIYFNNITVRQKLKH